MVLPLAIALGLGGAGLGLSIFGASKSAKAAKAAAEAIARENEEKTRAQNQGFTARMAATDAQTTGEVAAQTGMLEDKGRIAEAMRTSQRGALEGREKVLGGLNAQQEYLRSIGFASADQLMDRTSGANLAQSQQDWQDQAATLLDASNLAPLSGADQPGGTGDDPYTKAALKRRAAESAATIRKFGSLAAKVNSYAAPMNLVGNAVQESQTGIMPAQVASKLFQDSAPTLLAPSEVAWDNAGRFGEASMDVADQRGTNALGIAGLQYKNSTDIADLVQANRTTTAGNVSAQAQADAAYKAAIAGIYSGIGSTLMQGAGQYGPLPGFLKPGGSLGPPLPA